MKYKTVEINGVIIQITEDCGYGFTKGVLEVFTPDVDEIKKWTKRKRQLWIAKNNKRMNAICKLLNENKL